MEKEKIAVVMSTYNGEKYLKEQIESILYQETDLELELIIRDDGSKDNTKEIIKNLAEQHNNIIFIEGENIGYNASFFYLLEYAKQKEKYDYVSISDQDDIWDKDKLQIAINSMKELQIDEPILYGSTSRIFVGDNLNVVGITQGKIREITFYNTLIQNFFPGHSQVVNKKMLDIILREKPDCNKIYVYDSYITNVAILFGKIIFDNNPHILYRQHAANQVGFDGGIFGWIKQRINRIKKGEMKKYAMQIEYIINKFNGKVSKEYNDEMNNFLLYNNNFINRLRYIFKTKLYRQKKIQTIMFKCLYLFGFYKVK